MTDQEREAAGIKAIIKLQAMIGKTETEEQATKGWRGMSEREQEFTLEFHGMMTTNEKKKKQSRTRSQRARQPTTG